MHSDGQQIRSVSARSVLARYGDEPDATESNYEAMIDRVRLVGQATRPCRSCRGQGYRRVTETTLRMYERKISEAKAPSQRDNLRAELRRLSLCPGCKGSGLSASTSQATLCGRCEATGRDPHGGTCKACRGTRIAWLGEFDAFWTLAPCARCKGSGEVLDEDEQDVCPLCNGTSATIPATVKETGSSKKGRVPRGARAEDQFGPDAAGKTIAHDEGRGSAPNASPEVDAALRVFHGPIGDRCAAGRWGRIFSLWPFVAAGQKVLEEAARQTRRGAGFMRDPHDFLGELRAAEERAGTPNMPLRAQFAQADRQARAILAEAQGAAQGAS